MKSYLLILLIFILVGCSSPKKAITNYYTEDKNVNLYAFVGKKIAVNEFDPNAEQKEKITIDSVTGEQTIYKSHIMDLGFRCKYLVLKNVFNKLETDTVDFVAYDHYGRPNFEKTEFVLLYISKSKKGNYYFHQKYQFDYVEQNSDSIFYGYVYTIKEHKKYTKYKNKRVGSLEELLERKKTGEIKDLFNKKGS